MGAHEYSAPATGIDTSIGIPRRYAWIVFALTFGLLISDYMSRQVLNAVFPLIKNEWTLTDSQLGLLSGIVALMVGLLTLPLSILADKFGKVKSLTFMAVLWSLATLGCAIAESYEHMLFARFLVGVGEAAYGSVGIAVVVAVFPRDMRATLASSFMAGGVFGSFLGMALGGVLAQHFGWRWAFGGMAIFGLILATLYPILVKEKKIGTIPKEELAKQKKETQKNHLRTIYSSRSVIATYIASGLQLFVGGSVIVWFPSYLNRYYGMATDKAGVLAAVIVLSSAVGTILCGMLCDRLGKDRPDRKVTLAIIYCLLGCILLSIAFALPTGTAQLVMIALGMFMALGTNGPSSAMVANLTHNAVHSTAFATLTLANNFLGLALGPLVIGKLSDVIGLHHAFQVMPAVSILSAAVFFYAKRHYLKDVTRFNLQVASEQKVTRHALSEAGEHK
ncbi:MFS transporter [Acinetobacter sp. ANC 4945]|uniref:Multidrug DMT transporter permease n=1 Tax=Acinetobacter amyesii TaxID=2942470 RepID=A0A1T1GYK2_9GAMM|nr:MFS transporter [Acinetobacter amyesii]MCL6246546.1 MFS transporter [Acinetobacter amyesii]OOV82507.1 multidrug DMT transporter permease [Acinetobacter amyesii]